MLDEAVDHRERAALAAPPVESRLTLLFERARAESFLPQTMPDADLVNALAQYLEFEPLEGQALLEQPGPLARCRAMMEPLDASTPSSNCCPQWSVSRVTATAPVRAGCAYCSLSSSES